jgi:hypothetical protein
MAIAIPVINPAMNFIQLSSRIGFMKQHGGVAPIHLTGLR